MKKPKVVRKDVPIKKDKLTLKERDVIETKGRRKMLNELKKIAKVNTPYSHRKEFREKGKNDIFYNPALGDMINFLFSDFNKQLQENTIQKVNELNDEELRHHFISMYSQFLKERGLEIEVKSDYEDYVSRAIDMIRRKYNYVGIPQTLEKINLRFWNVLKLNNYRDSSLAPLSWIAAGIYTQIKSDFDFLLMVNGLEGLGKSTLALHMAYRLKALGMGFNLKTNVFFRNTPEDYIIHMIENTKEQVFIFDEARAHFWRRTALKREQKSRIMSLTMQRARNHVYILCTRNPDDVDVDIRDSRVSAVLYILGRGISAFLVNENVGFKSKDPFGFKRLAWYQDKGKLEDIRSKIRVIAKLPSFRGLIKYGKIPQPIFEYYKKFKFILNKEGASNLGLKINLSDVVWAALKSDKVMELLANKYGIDDPDIVRAYLHNLMAHY